MKKLCLILALALSLSLAPTANAVSPFEKRRSYDARFSDLAQDAWYRGYALAAYEYGLLEGRGGDLFAPTAEITVAELLTLSARLRAQFEGETIAPSETAADWLAPHLRYLREKALLGTEFDDSLHAVATRAQMAGILALALPEAWYDARNAQVVTDGYALGKFITDVTDYTPYQREILLFYKFGILSGVDETGSFAPGRSVSRAEVAAMLVRMILPDMRLSLAWSPLSYKSAAGKTLASLVSASESASTAPNAQDAAAVDAALRQMLSRGERSLSLRYESALSSEDASALTHAFVTAAKSYCEQMYNSVTCTAYSTGSVRLDFSSTAAQGEALKAYREETMARAVSVHDYLWESGYLTSDMSEYELARSCFSYLAQNCAYDTTAADGSLSHLAYGALVNGRAVCDGYTGAYNLLLKLLGIDCTAVFNDDHIWTLAVLDGTPYYIDVTNGDQGTRIDMSYFAMSEATARSRYEW